MDIARRKCYTATMKKARLLQLQTEIQPHIPLLRKNYHVKRLGIFGSVARGEEKKKSDIDVLVEFTAPIGFFEFVTLEKKLGRIFKKRVDLVSKKAMKPAAKKRAFKETVYL